MIHTRYPIVLVLCSRIDGRRFAIPTSNVCLVWLVAALSVMLAGCRTGSFQAADLPDQFRAARSPGDVSANLAKMTGRGVDNSLISADDLLEITIISGSEEAAEPLVARVSTDGTVNVPIVGPVAVANLSPLMASQGIAEASVKRGIYRQPHVTVEVKKKAVNLVTVLGAVEEPGVHELPRNSSDVVSALAMAGGLKEEAGTEVEIIRQSSESGLSRLAQQEEIEQKSGQIMQAAYSSLSPANQASLTRQGQDFSLQGPIVQRVNLAEVTPRGKGSDYSLGDRDVVMVLPRKKQSIYVGGLVKKPGQFEIPSSEDLRLLDAIALAGGSDSLVADKVYVIRHVEDKSKPLVIQASLTKAKHNGRENLLIAPGDMISIEQTPLTAVFDTIGKFFHITLGLSGRTAFF